MRLSWTAVLFATASVACANGAMPYAYQIFGLGYFAVYVVITVAFEAWLIGVWAGMPWPKAIVGSLIANAFTSCVCQVGLSPMHSMSLDPNPFGTATQLLAICALISAFLEALVWCWYASNEPGRWSLWSATGRSLFAHGIGIALGLAIFLLPARPYTGIESAAAGARWRCVMDSLRRDYREEFRATERLPLIRSLAELEARFPCRVYGDDEGKQWTVAFEPSYGRFDTGETRRSPSKIEWNSAAAGRAMLKQGTSNSTMWLMREREPSGRYTGATIDLFTGQVAFSDDPRNLGL